MARITFTVEPAASFDVVFQAPGLDDTPAHAQFIEAGLFGLLDVLLVADPQPVRAVRIRVTGAVIDPINSSVVAFRRAGRAAGRSLLDAIAKVVP